MLNLLAVSGVPSVSMEGEGLFNELVERFAAGDFQLNIGEMINWFVNLLFQEIHQSADLLLVVIVIGIISAVMNLTSDAFSNKNVSEVSFFACFALVSAAALECFHVALRYGMEVISAMGDFVTKLSPIMMTLILSSGGGASAAVFHPVLSAAVFCVELAVEKWIVPLIAYGAVLNVANNLSDAVSVTGFCKLIRSMSKWILAAAFTLFTGICGIYGFSAPALDALSAKTVKFAVGSLVPVVGNFLSDTLETVVTGSRMMKNTVGSAGLIVMSTICIMPILKITVIMLMMKLAAAAIEPVTDKRISRLLWDMADAVTSVFGMVVTVAVLFMICVSIIIAATGR